MIFLLGLMSILSEPSLTYIGSASPSQSEHKPQCLYKEREREEREREVPSRFGVAAVLTPKLLLLFIVCTCSEKDKPFALGFAFWSI